MTPQSMAQKICAGWLQLLLVTGSALDYKTTEQFPVDEQMLLTTSLDHLHCRCLRGATVAANTSIAVPAVQLLQQ